MNNTSDQTTIRRDVTVDGDSFNVSIRVPTEMLRFDNEAVRKLIEAELAAAVREERERRKGTPGG